MVSLCLNMIVKNESKIILRLLSSIINFIDTYCIVDTGSTDDTINIISNFFDEHKIKGKILIEPFVNFEYNRNFALEQCIGMSDYILLLDADMVIQKFNKSKIINDFDYYYLFQGSESFFYKNVRIVKNEPNLFKYIGFTHEVIICSNDASKFSYISRDDIFISDIGDGGSKKDKYIRDIKLLNDSILKNPNDSRSYFYLANSYYDIEDYKNAILNYKKRILLKGWFEEVWYSYYKIGLSYKNLNEDNEFIGNMLQAYEISPNRLENMYEIIKYYRTNKKNRTAFLFYNKIKKSFKSKKYNTNLLFFHNDIYDHKLLYEYLIIAFYNDINNVDEELNMIFNSNIPNYMLNDVFNNIKYYVKYQFNANNNCIDGSFDFKNILNTIKNQSNNTIKIFNYITMCTNGYLYNDDIVCVLTLSLPQNPNKYLFFIKCDVDFKIKQYSSIFYSFDDDTCFDALIIDNFIYINKISYNLNLFDKIRWFTFVC
jgi:hypothetical protein